MNKKFECFIFVRLNLNAKKKIVKCRHFPDDTATENSSHLESLYLHLSLHGCSCSHLKMKPVNVTNIITFSFRMMFGFDAFILPRTRLALSNYRTRLCLTSCSVLLHLCLAQPWQSLWLSTQGQYPHRQPPQDQL